MNKEELKQQIVDELKTYLDFSTGVCTDEFHIKGQAEEVADSIINKIDEYKSHSS